MDDESGGMRSQEMRRPAKKTAALVGLLCVGVLGLSALAVASPTGSDEVGHAAAKPKNGKFKGKVGTFSRLAFTVKGRKAKKLGAGVNAACQDTFGTITRFMEVAIVKQKAKIKRSGKIKGSGQDSNGTSWEISGKFTSKTKAKGSFQASSFVFNPAFFTSELCSGSENWKARLK